jgi:hypothetical protein
MFLPYWEKLAGDRWGYALRLLAGSRNVSAQFGLAGIEKSQCHYGKLELFLDSPLDEIYEPL